MKKLRSISKLDVTPMSLLRLNFLTPLRILAYFTFATWIFKMPQLSDILKWDFQAQRDFDFHPLRTPDTTL